jgi:uncharacterized protein (TIGR03085 family)
MKPPSPEQPPHRRERHALCALMIRVGPDAPTLCEGWATRELAAHLIVRENNPVALAGIVKPALAHIHDRALRREAARHPYVELVAVVDEGPPPWWKAIDRSANLIEFVVHHEDVRRGAPGWTARPQPEVADIERLVWKKLRRGGRLLARKAKEVTIELRRPDGEAIMLRGHGPKVVAQGRPIELLLYLMGRRQAADVELSGSDDALAALAAAELRA